MTFPSNPQAALQDGFGRRFHYLRLSVTDACNYRCLYCLPDGYRKQGGQEAPLSPLEVQRVVRAFAGLGLQKIRLTGGEPTLRRDLVDLVARVSQVPGVRKVALSTNGYRLKEGIGPLRDAGLTALNVSLNSLKADRYLRITGHDRLPAVLEGIDHALTLGFQSVKVNVVLLKGINDDEVTDFFAWARRSPVGVRFIELMPTLGNQHTQGRRVASSSVAERLLAEGWLRSPRAVDGGPAVEFTHPDAPGSVGYIAPYDRSFCSHCNRLRMTSQGQLRLCLFGEGGVSLRALMQEDSQLESLQAAILRLLEHKQAAHQLDAGILGDTPSFSVMGG